MWHNYSFDRQILQREGFGLRCTEVKLLKEAPKKLNLRGFAGDTMHLARLHDATRTGAKTYSLASLSCDPAIMSARAGAVEERGKISLKTLFSMPKLMKSGKPSVCLKELPPVHEIQVRPHRPCFRTPNFA